MPNNNIPFNFEDDYFKDRNLNNLQRLKSFKSEAEYMKKMDVKI